ncbi:MAG: hypothetical protein P8Y53_01390 [Pseudolabrys sp.]|jgi:hypothetical protein
MTGHGAAPDGEQRVVRFRRGPAGTRTLAGRPPVDDLSRYERGDEPDDYRHRMLVNAAAFLFVLGLVGAGFWLAETLADWRRNQDCALAGHRNCVPVDVSGGRY